PYTLYSFLSSFKNGFVTMNEDGIYSQLGIPPRLPNTQYSFPFKWIIPAYPLVMMSSSMYLAVIVSGRLFHLNMRERRLYILHISSTHNSSTFCGRGFSFPFSPIVRGNGHR